MKYTTTSAKGEKHEHSKRVRNAEERDRFIRSFGQEKFDAMSCEGGSWEKYRELPIPEEYSWAWQHFMNMWLHCEHDFNGNPVFTFRTILEYEECMWIRIPPEYKKLILKIKDWALEQMFEMDKD